MELELSPQARARVLGTYVAGPMKLTIHEEGPALIALLEGHPPVEIFAETPDLFFLKVVEATLEFGAGATAPTVTLRQDGNVIEFARQP